MSKNASTTNISRRDLVKGAGAVGLGALACGLAASSATGAYAAESDVTWDEEVDVLVVGAGTGAYAAVFAKDFGADKVTIIDKGRFGGTASTSGGVLWIPGEDPDDTVDSAITYMKTLANGRGNEAAIEAYANNAKPMVDYLNETNGWNLTEIPAGGAFYDYYDEIEGSRPEGGRQTNLGGGAGPDMWNALSDLIDQLGIEFLQNTAATELVVDETGKVIGVKATDADGKPYNIKADKAVVLATGGFEHNGALVNQFQYIKPYVTCSVETNTGDGLIMGASVGAALGNLDTNWGLPSLYVEPFDPAADPIFDITNVDWGAVRAGAGSLIVNKEGKRFGDETLTYAPFNRTFGNFSTTSMTYANIPAVWICDSKYREAGGGLLPGQFASDPGKANNELQSDDSLPDTIFQADTLDEIAEHFGIDADNLKATVDQFNTYAQTGVDEDFHRGERASGQALNVLHPYNVEGVTLANPQIAPVSEPPFYAALYVPGTCGTNGGLEINADAQVVDWQGEPIEGLYAVGNVTAGIVGGQYVGGGATLGAGAVESYLAMKKVFGK